MKQILIFTILLSSMHANAQTKFGIQAGVLDSRSKLTGTSDADKNTGKPQAFMGYKFGAFAEIKLKNKFYFSPEINYISKGAKYSKRTDFSNGNYIDVKRTVKTQYMEVPLNIYYKFHKGVGFLFIGGGLVIGYGLKGNEEMTVSYGSPPSISGIKKNIKFDGAETEGVYPPPFSPNFGQYKAIEVGANLFAGYEFTNGIRFNVQFRPNFNDIAPGVNRTYRNLYYGFNLGFGL